MPCVITPREWLSRCEGCWWDGIRRLRRVPASPDNQCLLCFGGICAAPVDRAAPHLLPNISCLFFHWSPRPPLQPLPQVSPVHEKAPCKLFSPSARSRTLKSSCACLKVDLLPGTSSDPDAARPVSLNIVNLTPYLGAQQLLADRKNTQAVYYTFPLCSNQTLSSYLKAGAADPFILFLRGLE